MEFKKLSDVEVVAEPTESANVLIEENGVIKKAPKTAVGGGMGGSLMLYPYNGDNNEPRVDRTYDEIKDVLDNGGVVLMSELPIVIAMAGGFNPEMVMNGSCWPLYFGMLVQTESDGEVIALVPTVGSDKSTFYIKSDNTIVIFESSSSGGPQ